ncbi:MAG: mechanosensitive ion channel family protein [Chthoniobacterales bacterium]
MGAPFPMFAALPFISLSPSSPTPTPAPKTSVATVAQLNPVPLANPEPPIPLPVHFAISVLIFVVLLGIGRVLRRRTGVQLGAFFQVFALATAIFLPMLYPGYTQYVSMRHASAAVMILAGAIVLSNFLRRYGWELWFARRNSQAPKFLSEFFSFLLVLFSVGIVLRFIYNQDAAVGALLTGSGIAGLAIGFALQDLLGNIIAGFTIYFGGQFKAGDWLLIENKHAEIMEINWRSTRMRTTDHVYLDVPNSKITKDMVTNFNFPTNLHALRLEVAVDYDSPPTIVKEVMAHAAAQAVDVLKDPPPVIYLKEFAAYSIVYEVKFWINDHSRFSPVHSDIRTNIWYALRRHGITIPYPIETQRFEGLPPKKTDSTTVIREALMKVSFAQCLTAAHMEQLTASARVIRFGRGESLTVQGESGVRSERMFIIIRGTAEVLIFTNGVRSSVATLKPGDYIGEMSVLTGEKRSATVVALEDCDVVEIGKDDMARIINESPELLVSLSNLLAERKVQLEGAAAVVGEHGQGEKQKEYRARFLTSLKSFFAS